MLRKKEKGAFHEFDWVKSFPSCAVYSMSKSLNIALLVAFWKNYLAIGPEIFMITSLL